MENKKAKKKYIIFKVISYLILILPVLIYNLCNCGPILAVGGTKLTFAALLSIVMVCIAMLTKSKHRGNWIMLFIGLILVLIGELGDQIGISLIMIGVAMTLDLFIFDKVALHYKEIWYESIGRQIVHTIEL